MNRTLMVAAALASTLASPSRARAQDFWTKLGHPEETVKEQLWFPLADSTWNGVALASLRVLPLSARTTLIAQMTAYAKAWTRSAEFQAKYAEHRNGKKPRAPEGAMSMAERKQAARADLTKMIKDMEANAKLLPADQRSAFDEIIKGQREQLKAIDDPNNPMYNKDAEEATSAGAAAAKIAYAADLKQWEADFPPTPTAMLRSNLRWFLRVSSTVDFDAKTGKNPQGKTIFLNGDYEGESSEWKALFRAGRETTALLRAAAQKWLDELK